MSQMTESTAAEDDASLTEAERDVLVRAAVAYYARSRKGKGADPDYLLDNDPGSLPVTLAQDVVEPLVPAIEAIIVARLTRPTPPASTP